MHSELLNKEHESTAMKINDSAYDKRKTIKDVRVKNLPLILRTIFVS